MTDTTNNAGGAMAQTGFDSQSRRTDPQIATIREALSGYSLVSRAYGKDRDLILNAKSALSDLEKRVVPVPDKGMGMRLQVSAKEGQPVTAIYYIPNVRDYKAVGSTVAEACARAMTQINLGG